jgi:uridylate kinase
MNKYRRILLKLSGEALMGSDAYGINADMLATYARQIKKVVEKGVQVSIVIGGGNIFRGLAGTQQGFDRVKGDQMGMLATVINSLALQQALENTGVKAKAYSAIRMEPVCEYYMKEHVIADLQEGVVTILSAGTGNPYFTTDSASALRAVEIKADALLKGTRVDGVYTADPEKDPEATKYTTLSFSEAYEKRLRVMDMTAFTLCQENDLPIEVFNMNAEGDLEKLLSGEQVGTVVCNDK